MPLCQLKLDHGITRGERVGQAATGPPVCRFACCTMLLASHVHIIGHHSYASKSRNKVSSNPHVRKIDRHDINVGKRNNRCGGNRFVSLSLESVEGTFPTSLSPRSIRYPLFTFSLYFHSLRRISRLDTLCHNHQSFIFSKICQYFQTR